MSAPPPFLAAAVAGLGVGLVAGRYLYFPVPMSGVWDSVMSGGGIGLIVASRLIWRARDPRALPQPLGFAAFLIPAALAASLLWLLAPSLPGADMELTPHELPGLAIELPDWELTDGGDDPLYGAVEVAEPGGRGRFIKVQWASGPVPTTIDQERQFRAAFPDQLVRRDPAVVAGQDSATLRFAADGDKRVLVTTWRCPEQQMFGSILSFVSLPWEEAARLQQRIVDTATCRPVDRSAVRQRPFPRLTPPPGFLGPDGDEVRTYAADVGVILTFPAMDERVEVAMREQPAMREELLRTAVMDGKVEVDAAPVLLQGALGTTREAWRGRVVGWDGTVVHALQTAVVCPARKEGFLIYYLSETEEVPADVAGALVGADCP